MKTGNILFVCTLIIFLLCATNLPASDGITLAVVTDPGAAQNICAEKFKSLLESRSSMKVTIYESGVKGNETEILKTVQTNTVNMAIVTSGPFDKFVPETRVVDFPYLFTDYEAADKALSGPPGQKLLKSLEKGGFKGIAFTENGFRHLTNSKRPVHKVKDVQGLTIRVMESLIYEKLWQLFGAEAIPMGWPIKKELEQGKIDGQENPLSVIWENRFYAVQKYLSLTGHTYSSHIVVANLNWFSSLPEKHQTAIMEAVNEAARYEKEWNRKNEALFLENLKRAGMVVDEKPDRASFAAVAAQLRDTDLFKDAGVQALLKEFIDDLK